MKFLKIKYTFSLIIGVGLSLLWVGMVKAQCINPCYVNAANVVMATNGMTWTTAFTSLQDALAVAQDGDEVWVAKGVQRNNDRRASFRLKDGVEIYGVCGDRDPSPSTDA